MNQKEQVRILNKSEIIYSLFKFFFAFFNEIFYLILLISHKKHSSLKMRTY